jgi:hypothetical protein
MYSKPKSRSFRSKAGSSQLSGALRILYAAGALLAAFSLPGCMASSSISESSNSISTSFNSSSKSSTSSSEEKKEAYLGDVRHYTAAYTRSNSDVAGLAKGLAAVSEKHGITNWEADNATFEGIGAGFARANLPRQQIEAYMSYLAMGDQLKMAALQKGFSQGR